MSTNSTEDGSYLSGNYDKFNGNVLLTALVIVIFALTAYITLQCLNRCLVTRDTMSYGIFPVSYVAPTNYHPQSTRSSHSGLPPSVIAALPLVAYQNGRKDTDGDEPIECMVCLGQLEEGEKLRVLPRCQHLFHVDCIDMWLNSHSTCPVCRANAEPPDSLRSPGSLAVVMAALANAKEMGSTSGLGASLPSTVSRDLPATHPSIEAVQDLERQ